MNWEDYKQVREEPHHQVHGTIKLSPALYSPELENEREIMVYLPPSYDDGRTRYPVIYMHDGQNLFDPATSFSGEWEVDQTLEEAAQAGLETIIVGIPNAGKERQNEYSPFTDAKNGGGKGDDYLAFITQTLKPIIDADFRTLPSREHTGIAGSSMGGLISLYAFFHDPQVFGFCGVMSPALWFANREIFEYVEKADFTPGRIYIDCGTREGKAEVADVNRLRDILIAKGYRPDVDLLYVVEKGAGHTEAAWAKRLRHELQFLLGIQPEAARRSA